MLDFSKPTSISLLSQMLSIIENEKSTRYFSRLLFHDSDKLEKQGESNLSISINNISLFKSFLYYCIYKLPIYLLLQI